MPDLTIAVAGENVDPQRTQKLANEMMHLIKAHYQEGPMARERVLEVLNALALCLAITVHATDDQEFTMDVFSAAFMTNLDLYKRENPNPEHTS
jgi:hypothetical protein